MRIGVGAGRIGKPLARRPKGIDAIDGTLIVDPDFASTGVLAFALGGSAAYDHTQLERAEPRVSTAAPACARAAAAANRVLGTHRIIRPPEITA